VIDFRYHLVSIISIFLALAVGIVLGAGPLQGNLGSQLTDQVASLRAEKQDLNDRLAASEARVAAANELAQAVSGRVTHARLTGHEVVAIVLPSADGTLVDHTEEAVATSGATLSATVTIDAKWFDPSREKERADAAATAATTLGLTSNLTGDGLLAQVLARLTVRTDLVTASESRTAALAVLRDAGLVSSSVDQLAPADVAVVVSGEYTGVKDEVDRRSAMIRELAREVADQSRAALVVGTEPARVSEPQVASDAVTAVREDQATARVISTLDHGNDPSGATLIVLALEDELRGQVGHYGTGEGATAQVPRVIQ